MSRILVLGATGTIGSQVARALLAKGARIRVGVRSPEKAADLAAAGAEVTAFDYDDPDTWSAALTGIDRIFVVAPFTPDFATPVRALLAAAKDAGIQHVVKLSAMGVSADAPFELGRQHAAADAAVKASGLGWTILQPSFFMDNFFNFHGQTIDADGAVYGASANQPVAYTSTRDIADIAAAALTSPAAHAGQVYVITGGEALTDTDVTALIGDKLGKTVSYVDLTTEQLAGGMADAGMPDWLVEALVALESVKAQGWASQPLPTVKQVLGREPESFATYLARA